LLRFVRFGGFLQLGVLLLESLRRGGEGDIPFGVLGAAEAALLAAHKRNDEVTSLRESAAQEAQSQRERAAGGEVRVARLSRGDVLTLGFFGSSLSRIALRAERFFPAKRTSKPVAVCRR
jgi:hypothetical protein